MLMTGNQDTGENGMGSCTTASAVAAVSFAGDDCRSQHTLCQVVGCLQVMDIQEAQEVRTMLAQAFGKASVLGIGEAAGGCDQEIQARLQLRGALRVSARTGGWVSVFSKPALPAGERLPGERNAAPVPFWFRSCPSGPAADGRYIFA